VLDAVVDEASSSQNDRNERENHGTCEDKLSTILNIIILFFHVLEHLVRIESNGEDQHHDTAEQYDP